MSQKKLAGRDLYTYDSVCMVGDLELDQNVSAKIGNAAIDQMGDYPARIHAVQTEIRQEFIDLIASLEGLRLESFEEKEASCRANQLH